MKILKTLAFVFFISNTVALTAQTTKKIDVARSKVEWVGKKIDRESVSTDNAGRTSGAEISRRLPNVFNNVSDADYLGQLLEADGNPIRGRKESWAKAIAEESAFDIIKNDFEPVEQSLTSHHSPPNSKTPFYHQPYLLAFVFLLHPDLSHKSRVSLRLAPDMLETQIDFLYNERSQQITQNSSKELTNLPLKIF